MNWIDVLLSKKKERNYVEQYNVAKRFMSCGKCSYIHLSIRTMKKIEKI